MSTKVAPLRSALERAEPDSAPPGLWPPGLWPPGLGPAAEAPYVPGSALALTPAGHAEARRAPFDTARDELLRWLRFRARQGEAPATLGDYVRELQAGILRATNRVLELSARRTLLGASPARDCLIAVARAELVRRLADRNGWQLTVAGLEAEGLVAPGGR